jgi:transposase
MAGREMAELVLSEAEHSELMSLSARRKTGQALASRARIVLECAQGLENREVAAPLRVAKGTVGKWRRRFVEHRLDGLHDEARSGAPRTIEDVRIEAVIVKTLESAPENATHWSSRGMAKAAGISVSSVQRIWRAFGLQPHRIETFKLSTDPDFVAKVRDVVGLYVSPPERAIVLCVDEKSQIQALDRSQPMLPMRPDQAARRSHDYTRHGTTSLFAALDIATRHVIECYGRHRATEFRKFLDEIEENVPNDLDVHLVWDNYATHKSPLIRNWLAKRPRWHVHLTPTSSSWLNQVERFFALITERKIRRGIHRSVTGLRADITSFIDKHNNNDPKPFKWTKSADEILKSIERFCLYNAPATWSEWCELLVQDTRLAQHQPVKITVMSY